MGKPVTSSETWTWLHSPVFRATPLDMKAEADIHFLQGINQLVGHGWPYSPPEAGEPGWRFYAAGGVQRSQSLVDGDAGYHHSTCSGSVFCCGRASRTTMWRLYLPTDDAFAHFTLGHDSVNQAMDGLIGNTVIPQILDAGYNFDFIDDGFIARGGVPYRILILPNVERMPLATLTADSGICQKRRHGDCDPAGSFAGAGSDGCGRHAEDPEPGFGIACAD